MEPTSLNGGEGLAGRSTGDAGCGGGEGECCSGEMVVRE